jgi:hypothetical protein
MATPRSPFPSRGPSGTLRVGMASGGASQTPRCGATASHPARATRSARSPGSAATTARRPAMPTQRPRLRTHPLLNPTTRNIAKDFPSHPPDAMPQPPRQVRAEFGDSSSQFPVPRSGRNRGAATPCGVGVSLGGGTRGCFAPRANGCNASGVSEGKGELAAGRGRRPDASSQITPEALQPVAPGWRERAYPGLLRGEGHAPRRRCEDLRSLLQPLRGW